MATRRSANQSETVKLRGIRTLVRYQRIVAEALRPRSKFDLPAALCPVCGAARSTKVHRAHMAAQPPASGASEKGEVL